MDVWGYFRFTSLSILLGFAFFCFCYATLVWRKRNASKGHTNGVSSVLFSWARLTLMAGAALAMITFAASELVPTKGVMRLNQSFAARARADIEISQMAPLGTIQQGDLLVQFAPTNLPAEIAALKAKHTQLESELEKTKAMALEIDEELARRHQNALSVIEQSQAALNNLIPLLKETIRIGLEKRLERVDKYVTIDRYIIDFESTRKQAVAEYDLKCKDYQRVAKLAENEGFVTPSEFEQKRHAAASVGEQISKLERSLDQLKKEADQLKINNSEFNQLIEQQAEELASDVKLYQQKLTNGEHELSRLETAMQLDQQRAQKQRDAECQMLVAEMDEIQANIRSLQEANVIVAPHDGEVVYRSAAPNSIDEHGVIIVMANSASAEVQFVLPANQVDALMKSPQMDVWIEDSVLAKRLHGTAADTQPSPFREEEHIVTVTCEPPMDLMPLLANEQLIAVQLTWHPPIITVPLFQFAVGMCAVGAIVMMLTFKSQNRPSPVESSQQQPATVAATPQIYQNVQFGLHHGSSGTLLQMLGNKFREALLDQQIDADLISNVEWSLERHQSKGVKLIRQGFLSHLSEHEDLAQMLSASLDALEENKLFEDETFQRLTTLLITLDLDQTSLRENTGRLPQHNVA